MSEYLDFALPLAKEAGAIIRTNFGLGMKKEWKSDNTPVTATDLAINTMVIERINASFPGHVVIGEESSDTNHDSEYAWVCDPVDGTIPFSHGVPTSTFSLALTRNGESIMGVVYDPYMDRLYYAEKGSGAFLNEKPITVSTNETLHATAMNIEAWAHAPLARPGIYERVDKEGVKIMRLCSVIFGGMMVACGEFSGVIFCGNSPWDCATMKIIVEEAGGKVTDIEGNDQRYDRTTNGLIVSNGRVHNRLVELCAA